MQDLAGNDLLSELSSAAVTIDQTAPVIHLNGPASITLAFDEVTVDLRYGKRQP